MSNSIRKSIPLAVFFIIALLSVVLAADEAEMKGWEPDSPYNRYYKPSELDYFRANVVKIAEVEPMPGMSPAVALYVQETGDDEVITVHVCPAWYIGPENLGLKRGDRVKIRGVWAEIDGKDVFMASKIKKGDYFVLKVRMTKDGTPFWAMTPEQLAAEKAAVGSD